MYIGQEQSINFTNQYLFFEEYQKNNLIKIKNDLKLYFERIDQEIFLSAWRKDNGYIPDGFKKRTILTIYGSVTFKRRVYKYWNQTKYQYIFLADKKLQIEKYSRISSHLRLKILEQIATGKRQRDICDMFLSANLTRATVSNIIKLSNFDNSIEQVGKEVAKVKIEKYLYINMDETFIKLRDNNKLKKYRIRLVTFHTGYNQEFSTEKRKVLANKRVYCKLLPINKSIDTYEFLVVLKAVARKFYSNFDETKVIIGGDGAAWIRDLSSYWINSKYILDKFHAIRYLKQFSFNIKSQVSYQIYQNNKYLFEIGASNELIKQLKSTAESSKKEEKLAKIIAYFHNNSLGVTNQKLIANIGVSIEGDISHSIKWLLGYGSKAFNYQTFKNMLFLKMAEVNKIDVFSFLKN